MFGFRAVYLSWCPMALCKLWVAEPSDITRLLLSVSSRKEPGPFAVGGDDAQETK